jgi:hypothetical protein
MVCRPALPLEPAGSEHYDKVKAPQAISPQAEASAKARAEAQGRRVMAELVRHQKIAEQLRSGSR